MAQKWTHTLSRTCSFCYWRPFLLSPIGHGGVCRRSLLSVDDQDRYPHTWLAGSLWILLQDRNDLATAANSYEITCSKISSGEGPSAFDDSMASLDPSPLSD